MAVGADDEANTRSAGDADSGFLHRVLGIEDAERRVVGLITALFFCLSIGYATTQPAAYALYLDRFGADRLPLALLAAAPLISLTATVFVRLTGRVHSGSLMLGTIAVLIAVTSALRLGLGASDAGWIRFALPVWDVGIANLSLVVVNMLGSDLLDVRQSKRLGGIVAAGRSAAIALGGLSVPLLLRRVGPPTMYTIATGAFLAAALVQIRINRRYHSRFADEVAAPPPARPTTTDRSARTYVPALLIGILLATVTYLLLKNVLYAAASVHYPDPTTYASRLGALQAMQGTLSLVVGLFVSGRLMQRFGVRAALIALPIVILVLFIPGALGQAVGGLDWLLFDAAAAAYVIGGTAMHALRNPAVSMLFQPLPPLERARAGALSDGVIDPIASGLAGLVLFVIVHEFHSPTALAVLLVVAAVVVLVNSVRLCHRYYRSLQHALEKRWISGAALEVDDPEVVATLHEALRHEPTEAAVTLLELLERAGVDTATVASDLLDHGAPAVRAEALHHLARTDISDEVAGRVLLLTSDPNATVRRAAHQVLARHPGTDSQATVSSALSGDDVAARHGALVGSMSVDPPSTGALDRLRRLATSMDPDDRIEAGRVLEACPLSAGTDVLALLLDDPDPSVQAVALDAVARRPSPELAPTVVNALLHSPEGGRAVRAAIALGPGIAQPLIAHAHDVGLEPGIRSRFVRVLRRVGGPEATVALEALTADDEPRVARAALRALSDLGVKLPPPRVDAAVRREALLAAECITARASFEADSEAFELTLVCVREAFEHHRDAAVLWASLAYDWRALRSARTGMVHDRSGRTPYAIEAVDVSLPHELATLVVPLLSLHSDWPGRVAVRNLPRELRRPTPKPAQEVARLLDARQDWVAAAALLDAAKSLPREAVLQLAALASASSSPLVAEAAEAVTRDPQDEEGRTMISTVERVAILRSVAIFAGLETDVIGDLARLVHEVELPAGAPLFAKGDAGSSLYVVVTGRLDVHDAGLSLGERGPREVIGELALLDNEPRMASARAVEDTTLFRLDQQPFYELLSDRHEVTRAIMHSMVQALRARSEDITALRTHIDELERDLEVRRGA